MKRKQNQDSVLARPDLGLYIVADGMGGHKGGETASKICIEAMAEIFEGANGEPAKEILIRGIHAANEKVFQEAEKNPSLKGMGTTISAIAFEGEKAWIAQVGDSRCYYFSEQGIWQLTRDHSMVQEKLRAGLISRNQLKTDNMRNVITRSVGVDAAVRIDLYEFTATTGDGFLICSDGLTGPLEDHEIFDTLLKEPSDPMTLAKAAQSLVSQANARGGDDNISVVLVQIN